MATTPSRKRRARTADDTATTPSAVPMDVSEGPHDTELDAGRGHDNDGDGDDDLVDASEVQQRAMDTEAFEAAAEAAAADVLKPHFPPVSSTELINGVKDTRRVLVPPHRLTPLKENWLKIYTPVVEHLKLQIRMNLRSRRVEMRTSPQTEDVGALQKAADFVRAFMMGFEIDDAMALLRLDDLYIDSFEIKDVKTLRGDNLSRAIGRIAGKGGKTKFTIENATRTRIVLAETHIHILGSFQNIKLARDAVVSLILGSPPGKVYGHLRNVASRLHERF